MLYCVSDCVHMLLVTVSCTGVGEEGGTAVSGSIRRGERERVRGKEWVE